MIRHGGIELMMNYYTDPVLLDVAVVAEALPDFASTKSPAKRSAVHA